MEFFDSHAHYDDEAFDNDREQIIKDLYNNGVTKFISAGYDLKSSKIAVNLTKEYNYIYTTIGISPNDVKTTLNDTDNEVCEIEKILVEDINTNKSNNTKSKIVGIGEIGLDYHWNKENKDIQKEAFIKQIDIANEYKLPIIIHTRDAVMDTLDILKNVREAKYKGIIHCCSLNREFVKEVLKLGFYISFAGPITFKSSKNAIEIINMVPDDKILVETDSPYLSPEPKRGTRNDSNNIKYIVEKIATARGKTIENIAKQTYENALEIFKIQ